MIHAHNASNEACTLPEGAKRCFLSLCRKVFMPRKADQRFCSPICKADFYALARAIGVKALESKGAHFARYENSERLQRFYNLLLDGLPHTTMEIIKACDDCAPHSTAHELRKNGFDISCRRRKGGRRAVYEYQLKGEA